MLVYFQSCSLRGIYKRVCVCERAKFRLHTHTAVLFYQGVGEVSLACGLGLYYHRGQLLFTPPPLPDTLAHRYAHSKSLLSLSLAGAEPTGEKERELSAHVKRRGQAPMGPAPTVVRVLRTPLSTDDPKNKLSLAGASSS